MRIDLTYAGLTEQMLQRLKLAAQLLASQQIQASVRAWDGTHCHVVVVLALNGYGEYAQEIARRRGTTALRLSYSTEAFDNVRWQLAPDSPAGVMAQTLIKIIEDVESNSLSSLADMHAGYPGSLARTVLRKIDTTSTPPNVPGLLRLARDPKLRAHTIQASVSGRKITLRLATSRVFAATLSDLQASSVLLNSPGWSLSPVPQGTNSPNCGEVSLSLDAYCLGGALQSPEKLPPFPDGCYTLKSWPDLGSAPRLVEALRVAQVLLRSSITPDELAGVCDMNKVNVSACLWAFLASGLLYSTANLSVSNLTTVVTPIKPFSRLLERIASRFGLSPRSVNIGNGT